MDFHDKSFFDRLMSLTEENNKMLRQIKRGTRWARVWHIFYWLIVIGISIGAFYFLQPYIDNLTSVYGDLQQQINNVKSVTGQFPQR